MIKATWRDGASPVCPGQMQSSALSSSANFELAREAYLPMDNNYDPFVDPEPDDWLPLDEKERIETVRAYHRKHPGNSPAKPELHAVIHVIVENQLAMKIAAVRRALRRLMREDLDRHEAIHAIAWVLLNHVLDVMDDTVPTDLNLNEAYYRELDELTAEKWFASFE